MNKNISPCALYEIDEQTPDLFAGILERVRGVFATSRDVRARREQADGAKKSRKFDKNQLSLFDSAPSTNRRPVRYRGEFRGGFDGGLEVGWYGEFEPQMEATFKRFDALKERIKEGDELAAFTTFGGQPVKLLAYGAKVGYLTYSYQLEFHGITILLHKSPSADVQAVRAKIGAVPLLRSALSDVYAVLIEMFRRAGVSVYREVVSRADLQIMTSDYRVRDFLDAMSGDRLITQCRGKCAIYSDMRSFEVESVLFRSSTAELCIYNKLAELATKDAIYYKWFCARFDELPEVLTRVEIRLRREALRRWSVNTVKDLLGAAAALVQYYTRDWFRILERAKVRGSENEQRVCKLWETVQRLFSAVFATDSPRPLLRRLPACANQVNRLVSMARGCVARAAALMQKSFNDVVDVVDVIKKYFVDYSDFLDQRRGVAASELAANGYY